MGLDITAVGACTVPTIVSWDERDVMLYALGVGAGQSDPFDELHLTTENSQNVTLCVLPSFGTVIAQRAGARPDIGDIDRSNLVHAQQSLELYRTLPIEGQARVVARVSDIEDKGTGALVTTVTEASDPETGELLFASSAAAFIRNAGGFNPDRKPSGSRPVGPDRPADFELNCATRPDQALLYRLCADRNPLHSDPTYAAQAGFSRPILHGLCTYGITVRMLLRESRKTYSSLRRIDARFTKPVFPGELLTVQGWWQQGDVYFRTLDSSGATVLDGGTLTFDQ